MSFGLLTAIDPSDIPRILRRCAMAYRGAITTKYPDAWKLAADEIDAFSFKLAPMIEEAKANQKQIKQPRAKL